MGAKMHTTEAEVNSEPVLEEKSENASLTDDWDLGQEDPGWSNEGGDDDWSKEDCDNGLDDVVCPQCHGRGMEGNDVCGKCHGTGEDPTKQSDSETEDEVEPLTLIQKHIMTELGKTHKFLSPGMKTKMSNMWARRIFNHFYPKAEQTRERAKEMVTKLEEKGCKKVFAECKDDSDSD